LRRRAFRQKPRVFGEKSLFAKRPSLCDDCPNALNAYPSLLDARPKGFASRPNGLDERPKGSDGRQNAFALCPKDINRSPNAHFSQKNAR
jgi:hypothetical protein